MPRFTPDFSHRPMRPELHLVGVAAAAPATELAQLMRDDQGTGGGNNITAMTLWSWSRVYGAPMDKVVTQEALPVVNRLASECIERWFDVLTRRGPTKALEQSFLSVNDLSGMQPWKDLLADNTPGPLSSRIPVFIAQGTKDTLVQPSVTAAYASALCRRGSRVELDWLPGVGHAFVARNVANAAVAWMAGRFACSAGFQQLQQILVCGAIRSFQHPNGGAYVCGNCHRFDGCSSYRFSGRRTRVWARRRYTLADRQVVYLLGYRRAAARRRPQSNCSTASRPRTIYKIDAPEAWAIVTELGNANIAFGLIGILSLPGFLMRPRSQEHCSSRLTALSISATTKTRYQRKHRSDYRPRYPSRPPSSI